MIESPDKTELKMEIQSALFALITKIDPVYYSQKPGDSILSHDLGLDSISKIELAVAIQKNFGVKLEDNEISSSSTVDELVEAILHKKKHLRSSSPNASELPFDTTQIPTFKKTYCSGLLKSGFYKISKQYMNHRFQLEVQGVEHVPHEGSFILAANHTSHLDTPVLMLASGRPFDEFVLLAAKDYFFEKKSVQIRLLKYFFNLVPFDRNTDPSAMENNIKWCDSYTKQDKNLIIFPEATRSINGALQPFKGGCALLAYELNLPILPAYIHGAYECLPKGKNWPAKGKITVQFGKPLQMSDYNKVDPELKFQIYRQITKDLEQQIKKLGTVDKD